VRAPIERALRDARLHPDEITHLLLAGGATRMPVFRRLVARLFQRFPTAQINPDEVVALGAAVQVGLTLRDAALEDVVMTDVAPFTLGIDVAEVRNRQIVATGLYQPIIERNTVVPVSRSTRVFTIQDRQQAVVVNVFQGEARLVAENIRLGTLRVSVPPSAAGEQAIDIRFTYDVSGLLEVEARTVSTGETRTIVIEGNPGVLTKSEVAERLAKLAPLKVHPRDKDENRALLARAERLYEERLGRERDELARWIDEFRFVLERQDLGEIAEFRKQLAAFLETVDVTFFS
jgi:molecular chaperone HscC